jgi:hypothetical protein
MTDQSKAAAAEQPADDIRSALSAAIASRDDEATDRASVRETSEQLSDERAAPGDGATEPGATAGEAKDGTVRGQAQPPETKQPGEQKVSPALDPPAKWKAVDKDMFRALPEPARQFLLDRHRAMEADHTRKTQAIAELKREYEPVEHVFAPHRDLMRQRGLTPRGLIEGWVDVERRLAEGDGVNVIKGIVAGYNIDPARVAQALGVARPAAGTSTPPTQADAAAAPQVPPEILSEIARLRQRADAQDRASAEAARASQAASRQKFMTELEAFRSARDDQGNLLHPHLGDVEEDMAHLALAAKSRGQAIPSLQELYEKAVRANPSTYEVQRLADQQSAQRRRQDEARAKAAAAKKAGSSVTGAPGTGQPSTNRSSARSLREEIMAQLDESA